MPTIVDKAAMNSNGSKPISAHSTFPLNQRIAGTYRFGLYQPCYVEDTVPDDTLPVKSAHDVRSLNLKAPLLGNVKLHKEFFDVPYSVMLPRNYEKLFVQPNIGEDIDAQEIGTNIVGLPLYFKQILVAIADQAGLAYQSEYSYGFLKELLVYANILSMTFSSGSLFSSLGLDLSGLYGQRILDPENIVFPDGTDPSSFTSFDQWIDLIYRFVEHCFIDFIEDASVNGIGVTIDGDSFVVNPSRISTKSDTLSFREFIERIMDSNSFTIDAEDFSETSWYSYAPSLLGILNEEDASLFVSESILGSKSLNIGKILAYQLVCAEFFTNSHVDYMYSAQLYRQFVNSLMFDTDFALTRDTFTWNGVTYEYDTLSAHNIRRLMDYQFVASNEGLVYQVIRLLFGYNRSLRYVDYFTGSRTRPLAVGDVNVQVNNGYVNIVDTITKRWTAKFLNQVNRAGRKLSEYMRAMFPSLTTHRDLHDPMWLAHIADDVVVNETNNTGAAQVADANSTTSNLYSNGSRFAFEYSPERYGICIGILYFDIERYYPHVIERNNFNVDRNDFFNPFLQFVGDQVVYKDELFSGAIHDDIDNFGYQGRDMQYKQKVDRCFGGFCVDGTLPGWLFTAPDSLAKRPNFKQSPSYIRSWSSEFDEFYNVLSGFSPSTYFHFIVINTNNCNASRPMVANPQLD